MLIRRIQTRLFKGYAARALLGISLLFCSLIANSADNRLAVYAELEEPANFPDESDKPVPIGQEYELTLAVLAEAGYEADVRVVPWTRLMHSLESQENVVGFSMTRTPAREDQFHWIGLIRPANFKLWALAERADEFPDTLEQATELRISAIRDDVVEAFLIDEGFTNLVYLSENSNSMTMLRRNRIDLLPYIESGVESYLARKNEPPDALVPVIDLEEISTGHYIVMGKQSDPEIVEDLRNAYQRLMARGDVSRIMGGDPD